MTLQNREPDARDVAEILRPTLKPCPFCGRPALHHSYTNETPMSGKGPLYRSIVACEDHHCGASVGHNSRDPEEAREKAIAGWQRRV